MFSLGLFLFETPPRLDLVEGRGISHGSSMLTMPFCCAQKQPIDFFSSVHVILKIYFKNEMQDQAAIGFLQFVDVQLDLGF